MKRNITKLFFVAMIGVMFASCATPVSRLETAVKAAQKELPVDTGAGMILTNMYLENNQMITVFECDEDILDIELLQMGFDANHDEVVANIKNTTDSDSKMVIDLVKEANYDYVMKYVGSTSGNEAVIVVTPEEL